MGNYLNFNGSLIKQEEFKLPFPNRAFRYGDGFFEAMRVVDGGIPLLKYNLQRIRLSADILQLTQLPTDEELTQHLKKLIEKVNEPNARLRLTFFRDNEGLYTPVDNKALWLAEINPLSSEPFKINNEGLNVGFYPEPVKIIGSKLSSIKTLSSGGYVLAGLHLKSQGWDDCIILNSENRPCEFYSSNLYIIKDEKVITPPISEGCVIGSFRLFMQELLGNELIEQPLQKHDILDADEVFLSSSIRGLQWVKQIENKTYTNIYCNKLYSSIIKSLAI